MAKKVHHSCKRITKKTGRKHRYIKGRGCLTLRAARKAVRAKRRRRR